MQHKSLRAVGNLQKFLGMAQIGHKLVSDLRAIATKLAALAAELESADVPEKPPNPEIAAMVASKVANRQCLQCGRIVPLSEQYKRGLCGKDRIATHRAIDSGQTTEAALIAEGLMAPAIAAGRKRRDRTALDDFLNHSRFQPHAEAEEEKAAEEAAEKHLGKKGRAKK